MWHINIISTISTSSSKSPPTHLFDRLHLNDGTVLTAAVECARGAVVVAVGELLSQDGRAAGTPLAQLWKRIYEIVSLDYNSPKSETRTWQLLPAWMTLGSLGPTSPVVSSE